MKLIKIRKVIQLILINNWNNIIIQLCHTEVYLNETLRLFIIVLGQDSSLDSDRKSIIENQYEFTISYK